MYVANPLEARVVMEMIKGFKSGETVIEEGTKGTSAYIILSGTVGVLKRSGGKEVQLATLGEGQVFGEMGLIEDRPRSATVRALSEIRTRVIDRGDFNELLKTKPSVLIPIMKSLFEKLRQVSDLLAEKTLTASGEKIEEKTYEVLIEGQTVEAKNILDNRKMLITKFPFLIGRESTITADSDVFYNNDLMIKENKPYVVSRNHMAICNESGQIWVVDRGSAFGAVVNGTEIGGQNLTTRAVLDQEENQIIIGPATSRFIFLLKVIPA